MAVLPIVIFPERCLREKAPEVTEFNGELETLIDDMVETMYHAPGLGLAANQVGVLKQVIVYDVSPKEGGKRDPKVLLNPRITAAEGELFHQEGCLSVVDFSAEIRRNARVQVQGLDRHGKSVRVEGEGLLAVVLQHEIDHLNGTLIIDRISRLKRTLYLRKLKKQAAAE